MKRLKKLILVFVLLLTIFLSGCSYLSYFAPTPEGTITHDVLEKITYTYVTGNLYIENATTKANGNINMKTGSAFVFNEDENYYYLLSNEHVVSFELKKGETNSLKAYDYLNNEYEVVVLYQDADYDLSILKIAKYKKSETSKEVLLHIFSLAKYNGKVYDIIYSIHSPNAQRNAITAGRIITFTTFEIEDGKEIAFPVIAHSATIYPGSSGSVLFNESYKVVGVNFAVGKIEGTTYSLSIPIEDVNRFIAQSKYLTK